MLHALAILLTVLTLPAAQVAGQSAPGSARILRIGYQDSPPVQFIESDGSPSGPVIEVLNEAARLRNIRLAWVHCPEGPDQALRAGRVDLWPLAADLSQRREYLSISEPYMRVRFWLLTRSGSGIGSTREVRGRAVAHARGALYTSIVSLLPQPVRSVAEPSGREAVRAFCESRADAALVAQGAGDSDVVRQGGCPVSGLRLLPVPGGVLNFGIAARKSDDQATRAAGDLQQAIVRLFDEGVLAGIWLKWGLPSTETRMLADYLAARRYARWLTASAALLSIALVAAIWLTLRWRAAQKRADAAAKAKASFLANMSHEIRTPMNGVLGVAALLSETDLSGEQREYVSLIRSSAATLLRVLNDVLDVVKAESGSLKLQAVPFDLHEAGREAILLHKPQAEGKGLRVEFEFDERLERVRSGDRVRVSQILHNLLGNAVKYTCQGAVGLRIEGEGEGVCLRVWDTGDGLPEELRTGTFEVFTRGSQHEAAGIEGTGLGLFICSQLVKQMEGRIEVDSEPGQGTEFRVLLPLSPAGERAAERPDAHEEPVRAGVTELNVLLVEDNRVNQLVASRMLAKLGCAVTIASSGEAAIENARQKEYDLVLMDCRLPGIDGYEAAAHIRADQELPARARVPIIALTASAYESDRRRCLDAGMDDHICKPVDMSALQEVLAKWVSPPHEAELRRQEVTGTKAEAGRAISG